MLTAQAVADLVGGRLLGKSEVPITGIAPLDRAEAEHLSFLTSSRYAEDFRRSRAGAVLLRASDAEVEGGPVTRIVVDDPQVAMATMAGVLYPEPRPTPGVDATARLAPGVGLGEGSAIGPWAVIGAGAVLGARVVVGPAVVIEDDAVIGDDTVLGPHVFIGRRVRIGRRVTIKASAVIGGTGFGYVGGEGGHRRIPHAGTVVIGDDVDIGSHTCIDRGSVADTSVGQGTKIDNLVHLGHNVQVGARCLVMAGVGVAGSTRVGNDVILAGHVGVVNNVRLGDGVRVGAGSKVYSSVPERTEFTGFPARAHRDFLRAQAALYRLAPLVKDLEAIVKERLPDA